MASSSGKLSSSSGKVASGPNRRSLDPKELPSICPLGKGLSGFVYETEWKGEKYARKDFPLGSDKGNCVFENEVKCLFDLQHSNIVKCVGYTVGSSSCSLLQEYVDGNLQNTIQRRIEALRNENSTGSSNRSSLQVVDVGEIQSLLSRELEDSKTSGVDRASSSKASVTPFAVPEAVDIISQIAAGIQYLHNKRVVHGDVKPKNMLLHSGSGTMTVKVADFGLVETKKRIKLVSKRRQHFEILTWKAPEQLEELIGPLTEDSDDPFTDSNSDEDAGFGNYGDEEFKTLAMADVYSFGLTCSHILGGKLLHPDLSLSQLRMQRMHGFRPELPSASCPDILRDLIYSCLKSKPWSRPSFSDIYTRLRPLQIMLLLQMKGVRTTNAMPGADVRPRQMMTRSTLHGGSPSYPVLNPFSFTQSWMAEGINVSTERAEYSIFHPTNETVYFHMLLDASLSTWKKVSTGDEQRVYKHLWKNFAHLVDTLRPHDRIYVWIFNKRTLLLWQGEKKNFQAQVEFIRSRYKREFESLNCKETCLYDAVAIVMMKIREDHMVDKKANFFLMSFTYGEDVGSKTTSLNGMLEDINSIGGRLHTCFIIANMQGSELYRRLTNERLMDQSVIKCEKTEPDDISRAFNTLRQCIIAFLLLIDDDQRGRMSHMTRVANYAHHEMNAEIQMMHLFPTETSASDIWDLVRRPSGYGI